MVIYLDASAVVKLVLLTEEHAVAMREFAAAAAARLVSSGLVMVELRRTLATREVGAPVLAAGEELLARLDRMALSDEVLEKASRLPGAGLRSLDALHVASAQRLGEQLTAFATYDRGQATAARAAGLPVVSPGMV